MGSAFGGGGGGGGGSPDAFDRGGRQPSTQPDEGGGTGVTPGPGTGVPPGVEDGGLERFPTVVSPNISAGGGFLGRTPFGTPVNQFGNMPSQMAAYNPFYSGMSGGDLADRTYRQIMKRSPDLLTQQGMQRQMEQGLTGQGLVGSLTSSPEFQRQQEVQRAYTEAFRPGYQEFGPSGQYYQPIYQSNYTNYSRSPFFYQPSYGASMMSPSMMGYGFGSFNPNPFSYGGYGGYGGYGRYAEGGEIEDEGITALRAK